MCEGSTVTVPLCGWEEAQRRHVPTRLTTMLHCLPARSAGCGFICMCSCSCELSGAREGRASGQQGPLQQGRVQPSGLVSLFWSGPSHRGGLAQAQLLNLSPPHPQGYRQSIRIGSTRLSKRPALMRVPEEMLHVAGTGLSQAEPGWARPGQG